MLTTMLFTLHIFFTLSLFFFLQTLSKTNKVLTTLTVIFLYNILYAQGVAAQIFRRGNWHA